ncbi:hypothetical protein IRP63_14700 (plasmid) [Clostridium botulinum]|uniref:Type II toxin-antitoxin system RelE/ParE family toxin n=2 Tax=Clostridium botulinum TaxID=1491 RepID=A0A9Q1UWS9_CLOBO|nr:hypothetical protein [Clostridium botulinum]AEB77366.1 hypothetical protein CbC4_4166 [Clostridium botulinum BKT015925]KEH96354.1 hypothetical protein Y848_13830 [Clostridium botulinum C/D str. Sp77]KEH96556.1 hypothetical protein Z953_p0134 [Clostridium botulinum D str. 16868]KGM93348.1 hypothetical protein Z955_15350 [Clostridium botulinum C/D str. DC5]KLU74459.1 hypothetical protein CBC3_p0164 [Clostridium botulinum V891]
MCYEVIPTDKFISDLKFYINKRKYKHIDDDVDIVVEQLEKGVLVGDTINDIKLPNGEDAFKARAKNTDTRVGQSNGYRIIYYVIQNEKTIFLLTVYYKKDDNRIPSKNEIIEIINEFYS